MAAIWIPTVISIAWSACVTAHSYSRYWATLFAVSSSVQSAFAAFTIVKTTMQHAELRDERRFHAEFNSLNIDTYLQVAHRLLVEIQNELHASKLVASNLVTTETQTKTVVASEDVHNSCKASETSIEQDAWEFVKNPHELIHDDGTALTCAMCSLQQSIDRVTFELHTTETFIRNQRSSWWWNKGGNLAWRQHLQNTKTAHANLMSNLKLTCDMWSFVKSIMKNQSDTLK